MIAPPNPSMHRTVNSRLRRLLPAGDLCRLGGTVEATHQTI
jgi:hypothetical protein